MGTLEMDEEIQGVGSQPKSLPYPENWNKAELRDVEDLELSKMLNDKYYDEKIDTIIKPGEIESIAYGEFLRDLKTENPKYIFNYDWRRFFPRS